MPRSAFLFPGQGAQFVGMGRTRNEVRDSTSPDGRHIGTNQIARYADHDHHAGSSLAVRRTRANSYVGMGPVSWAKVVHATHDTLVEDNVCVDFRGGCFAVNYGENGDLFKPSRQEHSFSLLRRSVCSGCGSSGRSAK